ncbi:MAG: sensor histidine kinase [Myxococcota bacterium]
MKARDDAHRRGGSWAVVVLAIAAASVIAIAFANSTRFVSEPFPGFLIWNNGILVQFHGPDWSGAIADLPLNEGLLVSVNGRKFSSGTALLEQTARLPVGTHVDYRVRTGSVVHSHRVPTMQLSWRQWSATFGNYLLNGAFFFAIGLIARFLRPDREAARALSLVGGSVGLVLVLAVSSLATCEFISLSLIAEAAAPAAIVHFAMVFPVERMDRTRRRIVTSGVLLLLSVIVTFEIALFDSKPEVVDRLALIPNGLMALASLGMILSYGEALLRAHTAEERLQAGIVFSGAVIAFLVPAIAIIALIMLDWPVSFTSITPPLLIFPLTVLYAVVRHDLLGAERFIRLTVGYGFATSVVILAYASSVLVLDRYIDPRISASPATSFALLIVLGVTFDPLRRRAQVAVDRMFFRSAVDAGHVLEQTSADLASLSDEEAIVRLVEERLCSSMSLQWATLPLEQREIPGAQLSAGVAFRGERLGMLACGPKQSGAPFSTTERELVKAMAGQAALALHNARSVRDLHRAQETLMRTERLAAIGEFAGSVAHGIRNPLAGIRAAAQVASESVGPGPLGEGLAGILSEADRLEHRVRTLLDFSRPFQPEPETTDIGDLLRATHRAISTRAEEQGVAVDVELPDEPVRISTDSNYLEEVVLELAGNALNAMPAGGRLTLRADRADSGGASITVIDTGTGVPPGVRDRIFELFFTTRSDGTGMGLAMVKKNVEQLGGSVQIVRSGSDGSAFRIELGPSR